MWRTNAIKIIGRRQSMVYSNINVQCDLLACNPHWDICGFAQSPEANSGVVVS